MSYVICHVSDITCHFSTTSKPYEPGTYKFYLVFILNMTEFVLMMTGFVINMTGLVQNMTGFVLNMT